MSILIEMEEQIKMAPQQQMYRFLKDNLKALFRTFSECKNVIDSGKQLIFFLQASYRTYRLSTLWKFTLFSPQFSMNVSFYNQREDDFLRAITQRMKIQTSILIRNINTTISPYSPYKFKLDHEFGQLRISYTIDWKQFYMIFHKKEEIRFLVKKALELIHVYDEVFRFLQPLNERRTQKQTDIIEKINRYRTILKNRKLIRQSLHSNICDLLNLKNMNTGFPRYKVDELQSLFMENVKFFQQSDFGLEPEEGTKKQLVNCIRDIEFKQMTTTNNPSDTIVMGLVEINEMQENPSKQVYPGGAHSHVECKKFSYSYISTVHSATMNLQNEEWKQKIISKKGELACKICSSSNQTSINSFKNELYLLMYLKRRSSPHLAKYFLQLRPQNYKPNEKDIIYMLNYPQNLQELCNNKKNICLRTKIKIAYSIAKGLCFLCSETIVHRDFKPANILVDGLLNPKIIDFGSCVPHYNSVRFKVHETRLLTTRGFHTHFNDLPYTHQYIKNKMSKAAYEQHQLFDIYGFGKILCLIFYGSSQNVPTLQSLLCDPYFKFHAHLLFLINLCLNYDPDERPTAGQIASFLGALKQFISSTVQPSEISLQKQNQIMQIKQ